MEKILLVLIYFAAMIAIGLRSAAGIKSPEDFYAAGRAGGVRAVTGSLLATILGSSAILGTVNWGLDVGWAASWMMLTAALGLLCLAPLAGRIRRLGRYTLPEMIGDFYGKGARLMASLVIPVAWIGIVAAQMIGAAKILSAFFGLPYTAGVLGAGSVFIAYTALGGQKSVIRTDRIQSGLILLGLALTAGILLSQSGPALKNLHGPSFPFNDSFTPLNLGILLITYGTTFLVGPDIYSRLFCAKTEPTAALSVLTTAALLIPAGFVLAFLGVYAAHHLPGPQAQEGAALVRKYNFEDQDLGNFGEVGEAYEDSHKGTLDGCKDGFKAKRRKF